jgi:4-amino-4-deoxy-L-arabinose transferase-like glycosyltransferase
MGKYLTKDILQKNLNFYLLLCFFIIFLCLTRVFLITDNFLWQDESFIIRWAQIIKNDHSQLFVPLEIGYPPFFPWVNSILFFFFKNPLLSGRLTSVIGGLITGVSLFFISKIIFNNREIGLIALVLFIFFPYAFLINRFAVTDNLVAAFGTLGILFLLILIKTEKLIYVILISLSISFSMMSKTTGIVYLYLIPLVFIIKKSRKIKILLYLVLTVILTNIIYSFLKISPHYERILWLNGGVGYPKKELLSLPILFLIGHFLESSSSIFNFIFKIFPISYIILTIYGMYKLKNDKALYLFCFSFFSFAAIAIFSRSIFLSTRHLYLSTITLVPLMAYAFYSILLNIKKIQGNIKYPLFSLLVIVVFSNSLLFMKNVYYSPQNLDLTNVDFANYLDQCGSQKGLPYAINYFQELSKYNRIYIKSFGLHGLSTQGLELYLFDNNNITIDRGDFSYNMIDKNITFPADSRVKFLTGFFPTNYKLSNTNLKLIQQSVDNNKTCNYRVYKQIN